MEKNDGYYWTDGTHGYWSSDGESALLSGMPPELKARMDAPTLSGTNVSAAENIMRYICFMLESSVSLDDLRYQRSLRYVAYKLDELEAKVRKQQHGET